MKRNAANIQEFADQLRNRLDSPSEMGRFGLSDPDDDDKELQKLLNDTAIASEMMAKIAKQVEFYINGDISKDVLLKRYKELDHEYTTKLAGVA